MWCTQLLAWFLLVPPVSLPVHFQPRTTEFPFLSFPPPPSHFIQNIEAHVYACGTWCVEERLELELALGMDAPSSLPIDMPRHPKPPIPPTHMRVVNAPNPGIPPDIPPSFPRLPAPDSVSSTDISESLPPSTTTETSTSDTQSTSPEPSLPPTTIVSSPSPTPTTNTFISSDPFPPDSGTVHFSTLVVSESSHFIPPTTFFGFSTSTTVNDDLIPSSSRLAYPTDNGNHASNPNNNPPSDGSVGGGNPSKAAAQRGFSTGAIVVIIISLTLFSFVGFVFWRRRQRQTLHTEHANRWWFSRTRQRAESYTYNATERLPTVYSSSFGSSFERTRSNSLLSTDESDVSSRPPIVEGGMLARTSPSSSLGPASLSADDSVIDGPHSLTTSDLQYFVRPDSESSYNESIPPPTMSVHPPSNPLSESSSSTVLLQPPPSPKYNSSYSRTSSGRSLALTSAPGSPTSRVFIPPIPPLPKSPPPIPIPNPFLDHNPFDDPMHH